MDKKKARLRRARRTRAAIRRRRVHRLSVNRSPRHIYAQVFEPDGSRVLASASTLDREVREQVEGNGGNVTAAAVVGQAIAERAREAGIARSPSTVRATSTMGRVKALAEAAREHGLAF